jgi:signal peptidase I
MIVPIYEIIPMIRSALERGQHIRMTAKGCSMIPFIRDGEVCELSPPSVLALGDIVLAKSASGKYLLHRIVKIERDVFFLRGDAHKDYEGPFARGDILGRVTATYRKGHTRHLYGRIWRLAGLVWLGTAPLGMRLLRLAIWIRRIGTNVRRQVVDC